MQRLSTTCVVVGGGPAGMMLGFLLARAGIKVTVLEKHADFLRDFRGDTIHPSTLELMHELGLLEEFLKLPHSEAAKLTGRVGNLTVTVADFAHLPTRCKFIALMPQWDFLDFLARHGRRYPGFDLQMRAEVTELIIANDRVAGVRAITPEGEMEILADLVVGCDGRHSTVRAQSGLTIKDIGAPIDVLWFRLSRKATETLQTGGVFAAGHVFVEIDRGEYWQCAFVIPKGGYDAVRARGLEGFRREVADLEPAFAERVAELDDWDKIKLLTVAVDRLDVWHRPGLLMIGDAAHAMSPIGGVGINLAVQDAVAAANILAEPLRAGTADDAVLARVQARRERPTRLIQGIQVFVQDRILSRVLGSTTAVSAPWPVRLFGMLPFLRRIPARIVGMGFRPEHIGTPERSSRPPAAT